MLKAADHFLAVPSRISRHHAAMRDAFHACEHRLIANVLVQLLAPHDALNSEQADHSNYQSDCEYHLSSSLCQARELLLRYRDGSILRHPINGIGRISLRSVLASRSRCRTPERAASTLTTVPGSFVMNVPTTNPTPINRVTQFQCLERIDEGDMVFDLNGI
jgi:hypothetical protein